MPVGETNGRRAFEFEKQEEELPKRGKGGFSWFAGVI